MTDHQEIFFCSAILILIDKFKCLGSFSRYKNPLRVGKQFLSLAFKKLVKSIQLVFVAMIDVAYNSVY